MPTTWAKRGSSMAKAESLAMSKAVLFELLFIMPWGLSKKEERKFKRAQFLFISSKNATTSGQSRNWLFFA